MAIFHTESTIFIPIMIPRSTHMYHLLNGTHTHVQKLYFHSFPPVYGTKYYVTYSHPHPAQNVVLHYPVFYAPQAKSFINHIHSYIKAQIWDG